MGARGPDSAAKLSIVSSIGAAERPKAPLTLSKDQKKEWKRVVDSLPHDWFPAETHSMLSAYCKHHTSLIQVSALVDEMAERPHTGEDPDFCFDLDEYDKLLKMQEREGRAMSSLCTRMRMTQQSTFDPKTKKPSQVKKAWER